MGQGSQSPEDNTRSTHSLLHVKVRFKDKEINALLDSGSNVNIVSLELFKDIPRPLKTNIDSRHNTKVTVADGRIVKAVGKAKVKVCIAGTHQWLEVSVLPNLSVQLILGTEYMTKHNVVLDFGKMSVSDKCRDLVIADSVLLDTPDMVPFSVDNICVGGVLQQGDTMVPNPTGADDTCTDDIFRNNFDFSNSILSEIECEQLLGMLCENKDVFVTPENSHIGFTNVRIHKIQLKENAQCTKVQPYRLSPEKRKILREQLESLARQGIITPADGCSNIRMSSPVNLNYRIPNVTN